MNLTKTSLNRLKGVHPDLVRIAKRAAEITQQPFQVTEGLRSLPRQRQLVRRGASKTMNSRHLSGHAVDVVAKVGPRISWEVPLYYAIADAMKQAAKDLGIAVEWGGDWRSFFDGPHFQLPWKTYPKANNPALKKPAPDIAERTETSIRKTLVIGEKSDAVKDLQRSLNGLGFYLAADGDFGQRTREAVIKFQLTAGLYPDGIVGPKTRRALKTARRKR